LLALYAVAAEDHRSLLDARGHDARYFLGLSTATVAVAAAILGLGTTHRFGAFTAVIFAVGAVVSQLGVLALNRQEQDLRSAARRLRSFESMLGLPGKLTGRGPSRGGRPGSTYRRTIHRQTTLVLVLLSLVDVVGVATVVLH